MREKVIEDIARMFADARKEGVITRFADGKEDAEECLDYIKAELLEPVEAKSLEENEILEVYDNLPDGLDDKEMAIEGGKQVSIQTIQSLTQGKCPKCSGRGEIIRRGSTPCEKCAKCNGTGKVNYTLYRIRE